MPSSIDKCHVRGSGWVDPLEHSSKLLDFLFAFFGFLFFLGFLFGGWGVVVLISDCAFL